MSSPSDDRELARQYFSRAAEGFHRASSFGHFPEPEPPYDVAPPGGSGQAGSLPLGLGALDVSLLTLLKRRHSTREFSGAAIPAEQLHALLWAAYGRISGAESEDRRTVPSAGGMFPLRLVVYVQAVEGVTPGFYEYDGAASRLLPRQDLQFEGALASLFRTHHVNYPRASAVVFFVGRLDRTCPKYGERGYRYMCFEAGHSVQNLSLAANALDLPHVPIGALDDERVQHTLGLPEGRECALYAMVMGRRG